jgi:hypothetical protein
MKRSRRDFRRFDRTSSRGRGLLNRRRQDQPWGFRHIGRGISTGNRWVPKG